MNQSERLKSEHPDRDKLVDEVEQLRTTLESAQEEIASLADERDRLLRRVTAQSRELQAANAAYRRAGEARAEPAHAASEPSADAEQEELRVAFEELQVLTEELEVANNSLQTANTALDRRVAERTQELAGKNAALAESELRFRTLVEGMPQLVWRSADRGNWTWASPQWVRFTGLSPEQSLEHGWLTAFHPDDRAAALDTWAQANPGEPLDFAGRIFENAKGRYRHFRIRAIAVLGEDGAVLEWLGTCTDVDDLLILQERQRLLVAELQHRVRNILTVVRSVFGRTANIAESVEEMANHFRGRLDSLARTQVVVTKNATGSADLEDLIRDELLSVGASDGPALVIEGPDVALPSKFAEGIGLAIHELTTNALKYGALKAPGGRLEIRWSIDLSDRSSSCLRLIWSEQGVPAVSVKPARQGFGSELITQALPYQLGAQTRLEFRGGGAWCSICVPLPPENPSPAKAHGDMI